MLLKAKIRCRRSSNCMSADLCLIALHFSFQHCEYFSFEYFFLFFSIFLCLRQHLTLLLCAFFFVSGSNSKGKFVLYSAANFSLSTLLNILPCFIDICLNMCTRVAVSMTSGHYCNHCRFTLVRAIVLTLEFGKRKHFGHKFHQQSQQRHTSVEIGALETF